MLERTARLWVIAIVALMILPASAGAVTVTNTNDSGPGSLRATIVTAAPGETVSIPAGTYTLTSGELTIGKDLTLAGAGAANTTIRAGGIFRVILVNSTSEVTISGLTIREGHAVLSSPGLLGASGGGIAAAGADLTLRGDVITGNVADGTEAGANGETADGGGVFDIAGGQTVIADTVISGNRAIANGASEKKGGRAVGAGIDVDAGGLSIERSAIEGNMAEARGGQGPSSAGQEGGAAEGAGLAAISLSAPSTIRSSTIAGNIADASNGPGGAGGKSIGGGSLIANGSAPVTLTEDTVTGNFARAGIGKAEGGGANLISGGPTAAISVTGSTIASNVVEGTGAATAGGDVFAEPPIAFADTIVSSGAGPPGAQNCKFGGLGTISAGFNLDSLDQCGFHAAGDLVNRDPLLGPLRDNGGPTKTMAPAANSPAVNQGSAFGLSADQRGLPRPVEYPGVPNSTAPGADGSDIGAVELQQPAPTAPLSNAIRFGRLKLNKKRGTAKLTIELPVPNAGSLSLTGKGVKRRVVTLSGSQSSVTFLVVTTGKARKALRRHGKRKVELSVTYSPPGITPATITRVVKLVRKPKHHHKHGGSSAHGKSG